MPILPPGDLPGLLYQLAGDAVFNSTITNSKGAILLTEEERTACEVMDRMNVAFNLGTYTAEQFNAAISRMTTLDEAGKPIAMMLIVRDAETIKRLTEFLDSIDAENESAEAST